MFAWTPSKVQHKLHPRQFISLHTANHKFGVKSSHLTLSVRSRLFKYQSLSVKERVHKVVACQVVLLISQPSLPIFRLLWYVGLSSHAKVVLRC